MKRERSATMICAALLAFAVSFGGAACVVTGFDMHNHLRFSGAVADLFAIGIFCGLFSFAAAACFSIRRGGWLLIGGGTAAALVLWLTGSLELGVESLLYRLTYTWRMAYNTPVIQWTEEPVLRTAPDMGLCLLAAVTAAAVAWTVCRRKKAILPVLLGALMLMLCAAVTDTVPDNWCLFLLLSAIALLMLTNTVRRMNAREGSRLTALLLMPVILASSVLFLLVPQAGYQAQTEQMQQAILKTLERLPFVRLDSQGNLGFGFGGTSYGAVNLANVGSKNTLQYAILDVTAPESGILYLRGQSLDVYNGTIWTASRASTGVDNGWLFEETEPVGEVSITTRAGQPMYFFPYYPGRGFLNSHNGFVDGYVANPRHQRSYTIPVVRRASASSGLSKELRDQCLQLPGETDRQAVRILNELGFSNRPLSQAERIEAIRQYVQSSAVYALQVDRMPEEEKDFAMWFLEEADAGYCIHFATAATVLLRAAGIPARYVTGYAAVVEAGEKTTITADQSHAWVEYYTTKGGWQILEATPADFIGQEYPTEPDTTEPVTTQPPTTQPVTTRPQQTRPTEPQTQPQTTRPAEDTTVPTVPGGSGEGPGWRVDLSGLVPVLKVLAYIAAVCAAVWAQYTLRLKHRKQKMQNGHSNARVLALWREARRYGRILGTRPPEELLTLAEKAKFSQHTVTAAERQVFVNYLRTCAEQLRQKPWYQKWLLRLMFAVE